MSLKRENDDVMERENSNKTERIIFRVAPAEYKKIETGWKASTCRKLSDYVRRRLLDRPLTTKVRNQSIDEMLAEMAQLKRELSAIGNNFNQSVKKLHTLQNLPEFQRWITGYEIAKQTLANKLDEVKKHMQKITESWLQ